MAKTKIKNWNKMTRVICPVKGMVWANGTKKGAPRCTACGGEGHNPA